MATFQTLAITLSLVPLSLGLADLVVSRLLRGRV